MVHMLESLQTRFDQIITSLYARITDEVEEIPLPTLEVNFALLKLKVTELQDQMD
jgi:hypothetical protein